MYIINLQGILCSSDIKKLRYIGVILNPFTDSYKLRNSDYNHAYLSIAETEVCEAEE